METKNNYVMDIGSQYFSGQGRVTLEHENKIYDVGNCPELTFYKNGTFKLVWEKFGVNTLNLLLGEYKGKEEIELPSTQKKVNLHKFVIKKDFTRKCILRFEGLNTADSDSIFFLKADVTIGNTEQLEVLSEELASNVTFGNWDDEIEFYNHQNIYEYVEPPRMTITSCGRFLKLSDREEKLEDYYFDPYELSSVAGGFDSLTQKHVCTLGFKSGNYLNLPITVKEFVTQYNSQLNYYEHIINHNQLNASHQESVSGRRLTDHKYYSSKKDVRLTKRTDSE